MKAKELSKYFKGIKDPRSERNQHHPLNSLLGITILSALAGIDSFSGIGDYAQAYETELKKIFNLPYGAPSHDTFQRLFEALDPDQFLISFIQFTRDLSKQNSDVVALDGKTVRNSGNKPLHIVSAWCEKNELVLGQVKINDKSNEITAIPKLLKMLNLHGVTITIDAMGCQRKIAQQIIDQDGDYLLALKGNQSDLYEEVKPFFNQLNDFKGSMWEEYDKGHGRIEHRCCYALDDIECLKTTFNWPGLESVAMVKSEVTLKKKSRSETRFYLYSKKADAEAICRAARQHWGIENKLHWRLDVVFNEDKACIRNDSSVENMNILRKWAINALSAHKGKDSIKSLQRKACMSWPVMSQLFNNIFHA